MPVRGGTPALYLVLPSLIAVLGAWPRLSTLNPAWFTVRLPVTPGGLGVVEASLSGQPCLGQLSAVTAGPSGPTRRSGESVTCCSRSRRWRST